MSNRGEVSTGAKTERDNLLVIQFVRYFIGGITALLVHLLCLAMLIEWTTTPPVIASGIGFIVATMVNYALQHYWVFSVSGRHKVYFTRYISVTLATFTLNILFFWIIHDIFQVWYPLAQTVVTGCIFILNFVINRSFTFRQ
jgi:putative flippase GtrA